MKRITRIRKAKKEEIPKLLRVFEIAKEYMKNSGNPNQWGPEYPPVSDLGKEIEKGWIYVLEREEISEGQEPIYGVFLLMDEPDPTYTVIDGGSWISDSLYGTIHRVASDGTEKGVFTQIVNFARERFDHLRIDTHEQNLTMQHVVEKHGFIYRGVIYLENGDPRWAYEWMK